MYAITERMAGIGNIQSSMQAQFWIDPQGNTTPCSDMAATFETVNEAEQAMIEAGLDVSDKGWFHIIDLAE